MKRLHVHIGVESVDDSITFYSNLFEADPCVVKPDYAKWVLDDPRVNFAISTAAPRRGVDHLGIEAGTPDALADVTGRLARAGADVLRQAQASCCYAVSDKGWVFDPDGVAWECFHTTDKITVYGADHAPSAPPADGACCAPANGTTRR